MFRIIVGLEDVGEFPKFTEAFKLFFAKIKEQVTGGTSWQVLETSNFIVYVTPTDKRPMSFYQARDFAYEIGQLVGRGELREVEEPSESTLEAAFAKVVEEYFDEQLRALLQILGTVRQLAT